MPPPPCRTTKLFALASAAVTALIGVWLAYQRTQTAGPFSVPVYRHLVLYQDYYVVLPMIAIIAAALLEPVRRAFAGIVPLCARKPWGVAATMALLFALGTQIVYHAWPLSMDEYTALFQSRIFAAGKLAGQYPPGLLDWLVPGIFRERFIAVSPHSGQVAAVYWPGFSALLTPFSMLGAPWLLNPLIGAATLLIAYRLGIELFGDRERAGLAMLLTAASPAVTMNALSFYSMPAHLLANAAYMLLLLRPSPARALGAGAIGSLALVLHNPVPHALFALPWIVWLALQRDGIRLTAALLAGYAPISLALGWGWAFFLRDLTGAPASGFGELALARLHGIMDWRSSTGAAVHAFDACKLWLWAAPGLVAAAMWSLRDLRRFSGPWIPIVGSGALTYAAYFFVQFDQGHGWGYRYFHPAWIVLPLLAVKTLDSPALRGYMAACAVLGLAVLTPLQAAQTEHFIARHLAQAPGSSGEARVVLIDPRAGYYSWDLVQNDPFLREPIVTLLSRGASADAAMMAAHFPRAQLLSSGPQGSVWGMRQR